MSNLKESLIKNKFGLMQLRARGLPTSRTSQHLKDLDDLRKHVQHLTNVLDIRDLEIQNLVSQRDNYANRLTDNLLGNQNG